MKQKDDESTKKTRKRRKQMVRKGLHTDLDKDDSEDSDEASEQDDYASGNKIPINLVPVAMKSPSIATYKIIKQGDRGAKGWTSPEQTATGVNTPGSDKNSLTCPDFVKTAAGTKFLLGCG
ncbi:hypothetical protein Tco_1429717 [Tanacetum coccineum]